MSLCVVPGVDGRGSVSARGGSLPRPAQAEHDQADGAPLDPLLAPLHPGNALLIGRAPLIQFSDWPGPRVQQLHLHRPGHGGLTQQPRLPRSLHVHSPGPSQVEFSQLEAFQLNY